MVKVFNRFRNSPVGLVLLALMIATGLMYAGAAVYKGFHADIREDMTAALQTAPQTQPDMVAVCLDWVKRQGMDDAACQPFADTQWAVMNGGRPIGDSEGLADWFYYYVPDGTMIVGPGRVRIWIPADRQYCPQLIIGEMTDGMCPTWMDVPTS